MAGAHSSSSLFYISWLLLSLVKQSIGDTKTHWTGGPGTEGNVSGSMFGPCLSHFVYFPDPCLGTAAYRYLHFVCEAKQDASMFRSQKLQSLNMKRGRCLGQGVPTAGAQPKGSKPWAAALLRLIFNL